MRERTPEPVLVVGWELAHDLTGSAQLQHRRLLIPVAALARRLGAQVRVLHVLPIRPEALPSGQYAGAQPLSSPAPSEPDPAVIEQAQRQLRREVEHSEVLTDLAWTADVRSGDAATTLMAFADTCDAELIVLGLPRRGVSAAFAHLVSGSVAHDVERWAGRPLLLVGTGLQNDGPSVMSWPPAERPWRVLLGLEAGTSSVRPLLSGAAELCRRWRATLDVLHVTDAMVALPPNPILTPVGAGLEPSPAREAQFRQHEFERLQHTLAASPDLADVPWTARVEEGPIATKLLDVAAEIDAHLIMIGAPSAGLVALLDHLTSGSVARELERHADRPVLVMPAAES